MGKVWIRAKTILRIDECGKTVTKHPGDWLQIGKQQAASWVKTGQAEILRPDVRRDVLYLANCGAVLRGTAVGAGRSALNQAFQSLEITVSDNLTTLPYAKTLLWDTSARLRPELYPAGIGLLDRWDVAVPISDYTTLAMHIGSEEDQERTRAVIHDLRVPVYDIRVIFAQRCAATLVLLEAWKQEPGDRRLAFLRAMFQVKPLVLALPSVWMA